jgi:type VI secretion system protein ImpA
VAPLMRNRRDGMMDVEVLLQPVSDETPSGEALDYDVGFLQLEIAARGRSEQQIGDAVSAGEDPDWALVESLGLELSARSKDIRVAVLLARARLQNAGFAGLAEGFRLLLGYVERYWDTVHPVPEPDEDDTIRTSALAALADPAGLLGEVRRAPLVRSPVFGIISLRDLQIASRRVTPVAGSPEIARVDIEAAFLSAPPGELAATAEALASCADSIDSMSKEMAAHDTLEQADHFDALLEGLREARAELDSRIVPADVPAQDDAAKAAPAAAATRGGIGEIRGRNDIVATLEVICRWYAANEPASPVPALLDRAKRLVSQDFLALLLELAPAGVEQFRNLAGIRDDAA